MEEKKAQAWAFDLMVALAIFMAAIILFFFFSVNYKAEGEDILNSMQYDGNAAADTLLSAGYPENWDSANVIIPGLLTNKKINQTKLDSFYSISSSNYGKAKSLLNTNYNFCLNFSEPITITGNPNPISCIGSLDANSENLIVVSRFTFYKDKPVLLKLYIWN